MSAPVHVKLYRHELRLPGAALRLLAAIARRCDRELKKGAELAALKLRRDGDFSELIASKRPADWTKTAVRTLADELGWNERTVRKWKTYLVEKKLLLLKPNNGNFMKVRQAPSKGFVMLWAAETYDSRLDNQLLPTLLEMRWRCLGTGTDRERGEFCEFTMTTPRTSEIHIAELIELGRCQRGDNGTWTMTSPEHLYAPELLSNIHVLLHVRTPEMLRRLRSQPEVMPDGDALAVLSQLDYLPNSAGFRWRELN